VVEDTQRVRPANSEVERLLCDHSKARELLAWTPKIGLEEGLQRSIDWFTNHLGRYKTDIYNI
jgi:dTDP-glucose 4,6-dehydratase